MLAVAAAGICVAVGEKFDYTGMVDEIRPHQSSLKVTLSIGGPAPQGWFALEDLLKEKVEKDHPEDYLDQFRPVPGDICTEQLSGGTTGVPKGIPRTHNDYLCGWDYVGRANGHTDESVGLVAIPVIAVPTSIGYGVAKGGFAALASMLTSCAPGVTVVNIDNGFGAGFSAGRILAARSTD